MKNNPHIFFLANGGVGTGSLGEGVPAIQELIEALKETHELTFFSLAPIHRSYRATGFTLIAPRFNAPFIFRFAYVFFRFLFIVFRRRPMLLHCLWGHPAGIAGALLKTVFRIPLIIHLQGGDTVSIPEVRYGVFRSPFKARLLRWAYKKADRVVVLSEFHKQKFQDLKIPQQVSVIPFGVNTELFFPKKKNTGALQLLWVASINRVKAPEMLLNAFVEIRKQHNAHLTMIGIDVLDGEVQRSAKFLGIAEYITFTGVIPRSEIVQRYQNADVLLLTSRFESQALVVNEALACGLVVCSTAVGIAAQLAPEITITVPVGDWGKMANEVCRILKDKEEYEKRSKNGIQWSRENDVHVSVQKIQRLYSAIANN